MNIKWYGHSCFLLTSEDGTRILTDPPAPDTGYVVTGVECDAVTVSHAHFDHSYVKAAAGDPLVITGTEPEKVGSVGITAFPAMHDKDGGKRRGTVNMYLFDIDGMRVLHAGDIGALPTEEEAAAIGKVDVLLVPIGGKYTLDYLEARAFANMLRPSVVIPMHYKTPESRIDVDDCESFVSTVQDCRIHKLNDCEASIYVNTLGEDRVLVLDPYKEETAE
ncbi:MAG: MBL fold metallo-hydrolase [Clostridiales bacterium]|nr:MBL fold metallo-hydrolase [Clostridiales bacterium]